MIDGKTIQRIRIGGKLSFDSFPKKTQEDIKRRLIEKDPALSEGFKGNLPGIKINGKSVSRENIHEFEKKTKSVSKSVYEREDLEKMSFAKLKKLALKLGETGRSRSGLIKDILKHN